VRRLSLFLAVAAAGCLDDADRSTLRNKAVDTSVADEPPLAVAARVDQVGRQLVGTNPFLGVDPTFHTLGRADPEIGHPGPDGVFITTGLVDRCRTDAELAAVLASELAKMVAEKRAADRLSRPDTIRPVPDAGNLSAGGVSSDLNQLGTQALFDRKLGSPDRKRPPDDTRALTADILKAAGYEPTAAAAVEPLLAEAGRHSAVAKWLGGRSAPPAWTR
jgi:hypothetical protein